jgi:hypothetical protein
VIGADCFALVDALIANLVLREGDTPEGERAHTRLHALVDAQPDPDEFLINLARRLGRVGARSVNITEQVISLATA